MHMYNIYNIEQKHLIYIYNTEYIWVLILTLTNPDLITNYHK